MIMGRQMSRERGCLMTILTCMMLGAAVEGQGRPCIGTGGIPAVEGATVYIDFASKKCICRQGILADCVPAYECPTIPDDCVDIQYLADYACNEGKQCVERGCKVPSTGQIIRKGQQSGDCTCGEEGQCQRHSPPVYPRPPAPIQAGCAPFGSCSPCTTDAQCARYEYCGYTFGLSSGQCVGQDCYSDLDCEGGRCNGGAVRPRMRGWCSLPLGMALGAAPVAYAAPGQVQGPVQPPRPLYGRWRKQGASENSDASADTPKSVNDNTEVAK